HEARIRRERVRDPLPDVADHLPTADGAVAGRQRAHVDGAAGAVVQVRALGRRRRIAPGESTLASRRRIERRRELPLRLGRQPPPRPATERLGLVPVDVHDRVPRLERLAQIEPSLEPPPSVLMPEQRMLRALTATPIPAASAPAFATPIAVVVDEGLELRVR